MSLEHDRLRRGWGDNWRIWRAPRRDAARRRGAVQTIARRLRKVLALFVAHESARSPAGAELAVPDTPISRPGRVLRHRESGDPTPQDLARLQRILPRWVVLWRWYERDYMAIAAFGREPVVVYEPDPHRLVLCCREAERV